MQTQIDYDLLVFKAGTVFSPAAPIDKKALFSGRIAQLSVVIDAINTKGQHAITFGERGVGKTSLGNILHEVLESIGLQQTIVNKVNCDSSDDFSSVWKKALSKLVHISEYPTIGFEPETKQMVMDLSSGLGNKIVPDDIIKAFRRTNKKIVFIFDEFDRIKNDDTDEKFADTMKALSDNLIDGTIVLVGVAEVVGDLIRGHQSIARSLIQIRVPRMSVAELQGIIDTAILELDMKIEENARDRIIRLSQGLPHYTHLLGLAAVRKCLETKKLSVDLSHVNSAITSAVQGVQHTAMTDYQKATFSPHKGNLYEQVLLACALAKRDDLGYFTATDVRDPLSNIVGKSYETTQFVQHLANFCSEQRGEVLVKTGIKRRFLYRFNNPILQAYVVIRGYDIGLLSEDMVDLIPVWTP